MSKRVIIAGASGLIGSKLLNLLLLKSEFDQVLILVRKELPVVNKKLVQLVVDFDKLDDHTAAISGHAAFCCLGSTKKKTPDLLEYRKIDHDYPLKLAKLAKQNGIEQYHLISAIGANSKSSNFYTKIKGETEDDVRKVGLPCLHIYRPSILTGEREESRPAERFAIGVMKIVRPLMIGGLKKYRSIPAQTVAEAMFKESINKQEGVFVHPSDKIIK